MKPVLQSLKTLLRGHGATVLVAALASAFGAGLLGATEVLITAAGSGPTANVSGTRLYLSIVALTFSGISIYVAAIVTTNTVATIVAGRVREIALARLLGATAGRERRRLAAEGLTAGVIGAVTGTVAAWLLIWLLVRIGVAAGVLPRADYSFITSTVAVPVVAVVLSTWLAAWFGSRRVLTVTPVQALSATVPADARTTRSRRAANVAAVVFATLGIALLGFGALVGQTTPLGLLVAFAGGILSFTGLRLGAVAVVPYVLARAGRLIGRFIRVFGHARRLSGRDRRPSARDVAATLGTRNALQFPERSTRATIGLVIGVGLVTMFVVAGHTAQRMVHIRAELDLGPEAAAEFDSWLEPFMAIMGCLVGFSAIIAAVGLVNTLTVSVLQRAREFGLARALGLSRRQLRRVITVEAVQLAVTAVVLGLLIGIGYGWIGAQSTFGDTQVSEHGYRVVGPVVPWWLLAGTAAVGAILAIAGSLVPARRAVRTTPVEALAAD